MAEPQSKSPLDLAGQVTWLAWTLRDLGETHQTLVNPILQAALLMAQIPSIRNLKLRKIKGLTVFGEVLSYPKADANQLKSLIDALSKVIDDVPQIDAIVGDTLPYSADWELPEVEFSHELTITDLAYELPLIQEWQDYAPHLN